VWSKPKKKRRKKKKEERKKEKGERRRISSLLLFCVGARSEEEKVLFCCCVKKRWRTQTRETVSGVCGELGPRQANPTLEIKPSQQRLGTISFFSFSFFSFRFSFLFFLSFFSSSVIYRQLWTTKTSNVMGVF